MLRVVMLSVAFLLICLFPLFIVVPNVVMLSVAVFIDILSVALPNVAFLLLC